MQKMTKKCIKWLKVLPKLKKVVKKLLKAKKLLKEFKKGLKKVRYSVIGFSTGF